MKDRFQSQVAYLAEHPEVDRLGARKDALRYAMNSLRHAPFSVDNYRLLPCVATGH